MYQRLVLVEKIDRLCSRFHSVAAAESRRAPLDPLRRSVLSPHPSYRFSGGPYSTQSRHPSFFRDATVTQFIYLFDKVCTKSPSG
ncbi:hypothetical protein Y032_0008g336 [Ancylostoma ceylanicum]|uniref:Uncharacterized protein n=1 Tax=Ancylostoma ceylanicum TaxID=53326 RepID=A0A016VL19_9BILA|nr:hypothetical protein Y032_0008g336 [Ancylostoma ceylanicum]